MKKYSTVVENIFNGSRALKCLMGVFDVVVLAEEKNIPVLKKFHVIFAHSKGVRSRCARCMQ